MNSNLFLEKSFDKIEKLTVNSNYYLLWEDKDDGYFYLYNAEKKYYALKAKTWQNAIAFRRVDLYSTETHSFVAYRYDEEYVYILYDDGSWFEYVFRYVGEECYGMRPVQTAGGKWLFFDARKRKFAWSVEKGYILEDGCFLGRKLNNDSSSENCFVIHKSDDTCCIWRYDKTQYMLNCNSEQYDFIEEIRPQYFIAKLHGVRNFELLSCENKFRSIGRYDSKPIYDNSNNVFYAHRDNVWCIIKDNKELYNSQWKDCDFYFKENYIFYKKSEGNSWQIFDSNNGYELCCDWQNIRLSDIDDSFFMLIDTDRGRDCKVFISDIKLHMQKLMIRSKELYAQSEELNKECDIIKEKYEDPICIADDKIETVCKTKTDSLEEEGKSIKCNSCLPDHIDYCMTIDKVEISKDGYLCLNRRFDMMCIGHYICWIAKKNPAVVVTEYMPHKSYKVLFYKEYKNEQFPDELLRLPAIIFRIDLKDIKEEGFLDRLVQSIYLTKKKELSDITSSKSVVELDSTTKVTNEISQEAAVDIIQKDNRVCFQFDGVDYWLAKGDPWKGGEVFKKRSYILQKNIIAILLNSANVVSIGYRQSECLQYKIIGEGKDTRFNQDFFSIVNKAIRDNERRILLFRECDGKIYFKDEVECNGYSIKVQKDAKGSQRKVILFDLVSKIICNQWYII